MFTQTELDALRKDNEVYVRGVSKAMTLALVQRVRQPRQYRSVEITTSRLARIYHTVAKEFNKVCRRYNKNGHLRTLPDLRSVLNNKYMATALAIMEVCQQQKIDMGRFILAQAETVRIAHFTLFHCYGYNALSRYESWEAKQQKKFLASSERDAQTHSKETVIAQSVVESHLTALKWENTLLEIEAPTLSVVLWYLWPSVSVWYLLAHEDFRREILETGMCTTPMLVRRWKMFMRSPRVQAACESALREAEARYGKLKW